MIDPRVRNLIYEVGFGNLLTFESIDINHHLITTLVERWRTEAHMFHLLPREEIVALEDVALHFGLHITLMEKRLLVSIVATLLPCLNRYLDCYHW